MVVRTIEILLEYAATILCIHKISKKKISLDIYQPLLFLIDFGILLMIDSGVMTPICKVIIYIFMVIYIRGKAADTWKEAIKVYILVMLCMMVLQYMFYFILGVLRLPMSEIQIRGVIINGFICCFFVIWKESYYELICKKLKNLGKGGIIFILAVSCCRLLYLCNKYSIVSAETIIQFCVEILILGFALWFNSEKENQHRAKELQMYRMYNQAFEETIATIRVRQHEFQNHINAIRCMRYTIKNQEELTSAQDEYCNNVLKDSKISSLLKLAMEPVVIGFLYAKITTSEEDGISVEYEINPVEIKEKIETHEMIELIGVLFDNAVEALKDIEDKKIILKLINTEKGVILEVANTSRIYAHTEIEKFCKQGYSTKGEKRGMGLTRAKEIVKKINASLLIQNKQYNGENYLCFEVEFRNDKVTR